MVSSDKSSPKKEEDISVSISLHQTLQKMLITERTKPIINVFLTITHPNWEEFS
jgi:hypothetical protein